MIPTHYLQGVDILKRLYARELPDSIRVRALVGLCKMGAQSGGNPKVPQYRYCVSHSVMQREQAGGFSEGSMVNLAKKLRPCVNRHFLPRSNLLRDICRFLVGDQANVDCKQWAAEGLAYLTLDADVKVTSHAARVSCSHHHDRSMWCKTLKFSSLCWTWSQWAVRVSFNHCMRRQLCRCRQERALQHGQHACQYHQQLRQT